LTTLVTLGENQVSHCIIDNDSVCASPCLLLVAREYWRIGPFFVKA